ncbi:conserved protein of unknown function [Tenacibaculum sp. 190524A02b]
MKKILLGFVVIAGMSLFNSCTDNSLDEIENREQQRMQFIDKDNVETPTTKG